MSFNNKVVIVTGGSSGIGAATAILYAKESANVAIVGRNEAKLASVAEACKKYGKKPLVIVADVSKEEEAKTIVEKTVKHFGKLDVLVNNAGVSNPNNSITDPNILATYDKVMSTNVRSVVQITSLAVPHLIKTKGNIVNISSVVSQSPGKSQLAYYTSKAALDHFTRCVALELAEHGVRANNVNPGPVRTDILMNSNICGDKATSDKTWDMLGGLLPIKGVTESEEIANLILYISSDKAKSITGGTFNIDRGTLLVGLNSLSK